MCPRNLHSDQGHLDPRDRRKNNIQLTTEIEELKKRKNLDLEDIKLLKVELLKMETLYKKYKEMDEDSSTNLTIALPFSLTLPDDVIEVSSWITTE